MIQLIKEVLMTTFNGTEITVPSYLKISKIISWLLYFWVMFGVIVLLLRVFLLAFSANMTAGFAHFIMQTSSDYLEPFRGIFVGKSVGETGYLDVSALFAIIVYLFIAWGFHSLVSYVQNKIDITTAEQKAQLAKQERLAVANARTPRKPATTR